MEVILNPQYHRQVPLSPSKQDIPIRVSPQRIYTVKFAKSRKIDQFGIFIESKSSKESLAGAEAPALCSSDEEGISFDRRF
jgi:hypothetical protein